MVTVQTNKANKQKPVPTQTRGNWHNLLPAFSDFSFCSFNSSLWVRTCLMWARNWAISSSFISSVSCIWRFVSAITMPYRIGDYRQKFTVWIYTCKNWAQKQAVNAVMQLRPHHFFVALEQHAEVLWKRKHQQELDLQLGGEGRSICHVRDSGGWSFNTHMHSPISMPGQIPQRRIKLWYGFLKSGKSNTSC